MGRIVILHLRIEAGQPQGCARSVNKRRHPANLPKTRSGKIMRRILRKIAANELETLGDTTTLADPAVVDDLIQNRANR